jgi:hypothetical protein
MVKNLITSKTKEPFSEPEHDTRAQVSHPKTSPSCRIFPGCSRRELNYLKNLKTKTKLKATSHQEASEIPFFNRIEK